MRGPGNVSRKIASSSFASNRPPERLESLGELPRNLSESRIRSIAKSRWSNPSIVSDRGITVNRSVDPTRAILAQVAFSAFSLTRAKRWHLSALRAEPSCLRSRLIAGDPTTATCYPPTLACINLVHGRVRVATMSKDRAALSFLFSFFLVVRKTSAAPIADTF